MSKTTGTESWDEHVRRVVDAAPPLSNEQRDRIALLLSRPARAVDDPAVLARAGKIVRGAMDRSAPAAKASAARAKHPAVIRAKERGIS